MRSLRLSLAEMFHISQKPLWSRFVLVLPLIAATTGLLWWSNADAGSFAKLWTYFAWSNQVIAVFALLAGSIYLFSLKRPAFITVLPGMFITFVVTTYILWISPAHGGPVGLDTLAATIGEEANTIEDVYEPYLLQLGFISRTPRGRCVTRLAYEHLLYGKYLVEDGAITGVQGNNIQLYINNMITGHSGFLKCDVCPITDYCLKGCRGAQYEIYKDMNMPIKSVCNFMRAKCMYFLTTIIYYANKYDCTEYLQDSINDFVMVLYNLKQEDEEFYNKWNAIICQYMPEI